jgi:Rad3-related DNA helicase
MMTNELILKHLRENFPFPSIRPGQLDAFEAVAPWLKQIFKDGFKASYFGIDSPTGTGKSPMAVGIAKSIISLAQELPDPPEGFQIWIITQNKMLQDQYNRDFEKDLFDLRGLDNYRCYHDDASCGQSRCARLRAPDKKTQWKPPEYCSRACEYDQVTEAAKNAPILLLNAAKALTLLRNGSFPKPLLIIYDEGHGIENALDGEASVSIDARTLSAIDHRFERYFTDIEDIEAVIGGMKKLQQSLESDMEFEAQVPPQDRNSKKYKRLESLQQKLRLTLSNINSGIQYVSCPEKNKLDKVEIKPLQVHAIFKNTFEFPTLFLSATLLSREGFCSMIGIDPETTGWFSLDSPFPAKNRPIYFWWRNGARGLNYQNLSSEMPNLLARIDEILARHPNERGIIHTHTYAIAEAIREKLGPKYGRRFLYPKNASEQNAMLREHERSTDTVLLSPSMTEGVDLKEDLCRFAVLCKVPYLPMNNPVVKARMEANPHWYSYRTAMTVVQSPGRGVRSETDFATTYFIDPGFLPFMNRARQHFPEWFLESIYKATSHY